MKGEKNKKHIKIKNIKNHKTKEFDSYGAFLKFYNDKYSDENKQLSISSSKFKRFIDGKITLGDYKVVLF